MVCRCSVLTDEDLCISECNPTVFQIIRRMFFQGFHTSSGFTVPVSCKGAFKVCDCSRVFPSMLLICCYMRNSTTILTFTKGLIQQSKYCHAQTQVHANVQTHLCFHISTQTHNSCTEAESTSLVHLHTDTHTQLRWWELLRCFIRAKAFRLSAVFYLFSICVCVCVSVNV